MSLANFRECLKFDRLTMLLLPFTQSSPMSNPEDPFPDIPEAIGGIYANGEIGSDIELFTGTIRLRKEATVVEGSGNVCLSWEPSPRD